eukprot:TRINITY_DN14205_c0_g1_i1.p1 TRINITY_DN14205_c0_g1~~TRINITY_DN14205_c0_g1_i1.p1  ORF type:complete len:139 (-),score=9.75 TRINITY_DN14205_c0_g1_i1:53-469(-)
MNDVTNPGHAPSLKITNKHTEQSFYKDHCAICNSECRKNALRRSKRIHEFVYGALKIMVNEVLLKGPLISSEEVDQIVCNVLESVEQARALEKESSDGSTSASSLLSDEEFENAKLLIAHYDVRLNGREKKFHLSRSW